MTPGIYNILPLVSEGTLYRGIFDFLCLYSCLGKLILNSVCPLLKENTHPVVL